MTRTQELHDRIIDGLATTDEIEAKWAQDRGERPRPILRELRHLGTDEAGMRGVTGYPGGQPPFTKADMDRLASGAVYPTTFLPEPLRIDQKGELPFGDQSLRRRFERNASDSATMAAGVRPGGPKTISVVLQEQKKPKNTLAHKRVGWVDSGLPAPQEDDYQP